MRNLAVSYGVATAAGKTPVDPYDSHKIFIDNKSSKRAMKLVRSSYS